jgi:hypothetical protein
MSKSELIALLTDTGFPNHCEKGTILKDDANDMCFI